MTDLIIKYGPSNTEKAVSIFGGFYLAVTAIYLCVKDVTVNNYGFIFYASVIGATLGIYLILRQTIWKDAPIITINELEINSKIPNQKKVPAISWTDIESINIGISQLKINTVKKNYIIDLDLLKYSDLKAVKSKIIEICENKSISYNNN